MLATLAAVALVALLGAGLTIYTGVYNVSATEQHTAPVYWALETGMLNAVRRRARDIEAPPLDDPTLVRRGFVLHRDSCVPCHGAPGVAPHDIGKALLPAPNNLAQSARDWRPAELYWVIRNGLKMSGMPAWEKRYADADLWALVAFVRQLPRITAAEYERMLAEPGIAAKRQERAAGAGDPQQGILALQQYACTTCHTIPGMVGANAHVGPPLASIASRKYLAGRLPNTPENMIRWIRDPKGVSAQTLMPDLAVSEEHARDMTAYLFTLK